MVRDNVGGNTVKVYVGGELVGSMEPIEASILPSTEPPKRFYGTHYFSGSFTIQNVEWNPDYVKTQLPKFNMEVTSFREAPPREPRSKRKRIRKKWQKRYDACIARVKLYEGCECTAWDGDTITLNNNLIL